MPDIETHFRNGDFGSIVEFVCDCVLDMLREKMRKKKDLANFIGLDDLPLLEISTAHGLITYPDFIMI